MLLPRNPLVPSTNFSPFCPAFWPAIANILIYINKELYYIDLKFYFNWNHETSIQLCHWLKFWWCNTAGLYGLYVIILSIISIKNAKYKFKNYNMSKPDILRLLWDIIVYRLVTYLQNMICLILQLLYKIAYIWIFV